MRCKSALAAMVTAILLAASAAKAGQLADLSKRPLRHDHRLSGRFQNAAAAGHADDGREFKSADGADFAVSASYFALDLTLAKYRDYIVKNLDPGSTITYETRGKNWFVISGTKTGNIFYEKHLLSHGMNEDFVMSYPASAKQIYDPIVARMAKSFRSGKGFQSP